MINIKNKKAMDAVSIVWAVIIGIIAIIFFSSGGITTISKISSSLSGVPTFVWIILGFIFLINFLLGGKK